MSIHDVLADLTGQGAEFWTEGDRLRFRAPSGVINAETRSYLSANKEALIAALREDAGQRSRLTPMSWNQRGLWLTYQLAPESAAYNTGFSARICSEVHVDALREAFQAIVDRHATLRTLYVAQDDQPFQKIYEYCEVSFTQVDVESLTEAELAALVLDTYELPFDLENGPILRVHLFTRNATDHVLLLNVHHTSLDGWSLWLLLGELGSLYAANVGGGSTSLPRSEVEYTDFVEWQSELLTGTRGEELWAYWKETLAGDLPALDIPTDYPRRSTPTHQGRSHDFVLNAHLAQKLRDLARAEGTTLYNVLLAAFFLLLHRYSGQEEVLVGSPVFGRSESKFAKIIGHFVNMVVLESTYAGDPTFTDFLAQVRQTVLGALESQDFPFSLLVERLNLEYDASRSPLFQATFDLQRVHQTGELGALFVPGAESGQVDLGGLLLEHFPMPQQLGQFDLCLQILETGEALPGTLKFSTDLFREDTIGRMIEHYLALLNGIVADPEQRLSALSLLTADEREQILGAWNATEAAYPQEACVHQLFEQQVARTPEAVALRFEDRQLTYAQLNERANQLAHFLRDQGVDTDALVGVCMERSPETVIALLGILKAGGAYVPLDPAYPQERLSLMLEDTQLTIILTKEDLAGNLPNHQAKTVLMDRDWPDISQQPKDNVANRAAPDSLMYVVFTSGSTGRPKGVTATHRGAVNRMHWMWRTYPFVRDEVNCHKTTLNFVDSIWEIFGAMLQGVPTVIIPDMEVKDTSLLISTLVENTVTRIVLVPSLLNTILDFEDSSQLEHLKFWVSSGEALSIELARRFRDRFPNSKLINLYGSSEVAADVTCYDTSEMTDQLNSVPIGRPIANSEIYILDANRKPVPIMVPGEIYVGGAGLARGYLNDSQKTAEKFVAHPFASNTHARLYRTGDLARWLPDGNIEYLGRVDHQVKVRGYRIELGEIEAALRREDSVEKVVVLAREDEPGDKQLVAYVVGQADELLDTLELRERLKAVLPSYMLPSAIVRLEAFPLTPNGKIDRRALPKPDYVRQSGGEYVSPRDEVEEGLVAIWQTVLGLERVGALDDFFRLGGHSLHATRVMSRVRATFDVELPLLSLFEKPVLADFAGEVRSQWAGGVAEVQPIEAVVAEDVAPLSSGQRQMWFLDQFEGAGPAYNIPMVFELRGKVDIVRLEQALNTLVTRHESLRTTYRLDEAGPVQCVNAAEPFKLTQIDLSGHPAASREAEALRLVVEEGQRPFDLNRELLMRAVLVKLEEETCYFLINVHHIAADGWSVRVLLTELVQLYNAGARGEEADLGPQPLQPVDYAAWEQEWMESGAIERQLAYWREQLGGELPVVELPVKGSATSASRYVGTREIFYIDAELTQALHALAARTNTTMFMVLLTTFKLLLYRYSGQEDIIAGSPVAHRNHEELERVIGCFINTLLLRTDFSGDPSVEELLGRVRRITLDGYSHQDMPFDQLAQMLGGHQGGLPFYRTLFALQNLPYEPVELEGMTLRYLLIDPGIAKLDLSLYVQDWHEGSMMALFEYRVDLFEADTIRRMQQHFLRLLRAMVANPEQRVSALSLLTEAEREQILLAWNATEAPYPQDICVHQLFEQQAARTPDAVAVCFEDQHLTYTQLNQRANQLAHHLRDQGVRPGSFVGVCMERSLEMVISLYAILKAGGAYVPLDPEYPAQRLTYMIENARPPLLLTQSHLVDLVSEDETQVVAVDKLWAALGEFDSENLEPFATADDLIYMIYTSGSTGQPKGAMNAHRGVVNRLLWMQDEYQLDQTDVVLQKTPFSFDVSVWEFFWPLLVGAQLVVARPDGHRDPAYLVDIVREHAITTIHFVPSMLELFLDHRAVSSCTSLRRVICSGEALPLELQN